MDAKEMHKLREAVIEGLKDGRKIDALKSALHDSGYSEADIGSITSDIDHTKIRRRSPKRDFKLDYVAAIIVIAIIAVVVYFLLFTGNQQTLTNEIKPPDTGNQNKPPVGTNQTSIKICYASNETIKRMMIEAGTQCDKWYIIMSSP